MSISISVVLGTVNRLPFLQRALASVTNACGGLDHEIIIVDGGSDDGTLDYLRKNIRKEITVIAQGERLGAVKAFNTGFQAARGEFVAAMNDDAEYIGSPLYFAVQTLRDDKSIGQIAIPFQTFQVSSPDEIECARQCDAPPPETQLVSLPVLGLVTYANFGVISRDLGNELGWWGEHYYQYAGDTELSTQVWAKGLRVVELDPALGYLVHYQAQDGTRVPNVEAPHFNARWRGNDSPLVKRVRG